MPAAIRHSGTQSSPGAVPHRSRGLLISASLALACLLTLPPHSVQAEIRTITAFGEHRLSDRETREQGVRLATEQAKKHALEEVATYLESITVVRDLDVTQDEIRSYTAGVVIVQAQKVKTELEGEDIVIKVSLSVQVDTEEVARAITLLKQSEDARTELVALKHELVHVQEELERANRALKATTSSEQARRLNQQRQELLDQAQSNGLVAQAWTEWVLTASLMTHPGMSTDNAQVQALLGVAGRLSPSNSHVAIARQVITTKAAPLPPQPPRPPQPGSATGMSAVPVPDEAGASRSLSNVHQLNPLLPDAMGPSPAVGSSVTIMQVPLQAGATVTRPSVSLGKMYQQVPSTKIDKPARSTLHTLQPVGASPLAPKGAKDSHSSNEEGQPQ